MYNLEKATPESVGISSQAILRFMGKIKKYKMNIHSFMFIRGGQVCVEGYAKPCFHKNFPHRLYSCSKSFVALAMGKLVGEGKVSLGDCICDYFPEYVDENTDKLIKSTTIEDMLKMSVPMLTDSYTMRPDLSWTESFFKVNGVKPSGSVFDYNSAGSFLLGCLVERLTGQDFISYLRPEFDEIGVKDIWCVKSPDGYAWGSSGVVCTTEDFARVALWAMNKGVHNGKQLLPLNYMEKATSKQISNYVENMYTPRNAEGYGYQFWITDKGFSMYGMGSQYAFCFPEKEFLFVCNGDTQVNGYDFCGEFLYDWVSEIYEDIQEALPQNPQAQTALTNALKEFSLPDCVGEKDSKWAEYIHNECYELAENPMGIEWFKVRFDGAKGEFLYKNRRGEKRFFFGLGEYIEGSFPERNFYSKQVFVPSEEEQKMVAVGEWVEERKLLLRVYITDSNFGNLFITLGFKEDEVGVVMKKRAEFFLNDYEGVAYGKKKK